MATYLIIGVPFMLVAFGLAFASGWRPSKPWGYVLAILLMLTAVFDSLIIYADIVGYDQAKILGVHIGTAPIEDFLYTIAAALLVPALWRMFEQK